MAFGRKKTVASATPAAQPVSPTPMISLRKEAAVSLKKHGLEVDGTGGLSVYLVLDHSGSMQGHYAAGSVQRITEQALALAVEIDSDGKVPVFYFGTSVSRPQIVSLDDSGRGDSYVGWVDRTHRSVEWGATDYDKAVRAVAAYHAKHGNEEPGLVIFQTDGSPGTWGGGDDYENARQALRDVSNDPRTENLFFGFVGYGPKRQVEFLFELDEIDGRKRDNASAFHAADPQRTLNSDLYDGVLREFTKDFLPQVL